MLGLALRVKEGSCKQVKSLFLEGEVLLLLGKGFLTFIELDGSLALAFGANAANLNLLRAFGARFK